MQRLLSYFVAVRKPSLDSARPVDISVKQLNSEHMRDLPFSSPLPMTATAETPYTPPRRVASTHALGLSPAVSSRLLGAELEWTGWDTKQPSDMGYYLTAT